MKKFTFIVHPSFIYLYNACQRLSSKEPEKNKNTGRYIYGSYVHIYKDSYGKIHQVNIKDMIDNMNKGMIYYPSYTRKDDTYKNYMKMMQYDSNIKNDNNTDSLIVKYNAQWKKGKSNIESSIINHIDNNSINSRTNKRGYTFKINPRLRSSYNTDNNGRNKILQPILMSDTSMTRFIKTSSSFHNNNNRSIQYRVDKNNILIGPSQYDKCLYTNRLSESNNYQNKIDKDVNAINNEYNNTHEDHTNIDSNDNDKDPFEKFESNNMNNDHMNRTKDSSLYNTHNRRFNSNKPHPRAYEPSVKNISTDKNNNRYVYNTTSTSYFSNKINTGDSINNNSINHHISLNRINHSNEGKSSYDTLTAFSKPYNRLSSHNIDRLLLEKSSREINRQYNDIKYIKSRLISTAPSQSMLSIKNALIIPDTTIYNDINNVDIPTNGSRLISYDKDIVKPKQKTKIKPKN